MARKNTKVNPAAQSGDYQALIEDWDLVTALLGGTRAMREAGEEYLPKHTEEDTARYEARLRGVRTLG